MLVSLFRSNRPAVLLLLIALVPLVLLGTWDGPAPGGQPHMPLYTLVHAVVGGNVWLCWLAGILLVGLLCVQLTGLANDTDLLDQRTHLPALLFPLLLGAFGHGTLLGPALAGMPFVVAAMRRVFRVSQTGPALARLFDAGFLLGLAALFYLPYLFLVVVVLSTISVTRPFHWREYVVPVLGGAVAFLLAWSVAHLTGVAPWKPFHTIWPGASTVGEVPRLQHITLYITCALLLAIAVPVYAAGYQRSVIRVKNLRAAFLGLMAALAVLVLLLRGLAGQFPPVLVAMPLSIFLSHALVGARLAWLRETAVWVILLCALWVQW